MFRGFQCVMENAIKTFICAWNSHRIPGPRGGVPNELASQHSHVSPLPYNSIPSTTQMIGLHEAGGRRLCRNVSYGHDPLHGQQQLQLLRERDIFSMFDMNIVFQSVLHGNGELFKRCIHRFIFLTNNLSELNV